jgi:hypothetical protein
MNKWGYKQNQIISIGRSLGCSPALYHAINRDVAAVILISPFLSIHKLLK